LLFGLPLLAGVVLTSLDVMLLLALQRFGFRKLEAFVATLLVVIAGCFAYELILARPDWAAVATGFVPRSEIVTNPAMLYIAIGILGATVMPHNLYLHSSIVQTRKVEVGDERGAIRMATIDTVISLSLALLINAAILILAASVFHASGQTGVADIEDAHRLLSPMLGAGAASVVFALALLASGQNSTITGTLAGQIVMEGFLDLKLPLWLRRIVTRGLAIVPAALVIGIAGEGATTSLLVLSQVVLSLQLPFAVIPLVAFTSDKRLMGEFASPVALKLAAWGVAGVIVALNVKLLWGVIAG
jgi:manganese transport protein